MITIYHLSTSRSERVIWLLEELGLRYTLGKYQREPTGAAPETLRLIHPLGIVAYLKRIEARPAYQKAMALAAMGE